MNDTAPHLAAQAIHASADRLLASAHGKPDAAEKQRQGDALHRIAGHVASGAEAVRAALGAPGEARDGITAADRERAAREAYSLALRRTEQGTQRRIDAPMQAGWEQGGAEVPIHRATLREADAFHELALALHYEGFWDYSRGLLLESLGDFEAAIRVFDGLRGHYAQHGPMQAERCRRKLAGTFDAQAEHRAAFAKAVGNMGRHGAGTGTALKVLGVVASLFGRGAGKSASPPPKPAPATRAQDPAALDRAATTAQVFAEHLANGDFDAAHAMLATDLRHLTADDLREAYASMTCHDDGDGGADAGDVAVTVMSSEGDMPDRGDSDIGWVYVAISGEEFNEAVTVVVTDEGGEARIRELEWGRP